MKQRIEGLDAPDAVTSMIAVMLKGTIEVWAPLIGALEMRCDVEPISPKDLQEIIEIMRRVLGKMRDAQESIFVGTVNRAGTTEIVRILFPFELVKP